MVGVVRQARELGGRDLLGREAAAADVRLEAHAFRKRLTARILQPIRREIPFFVTRRQRKWMVVGIRVAAVHPLQELRSLLERRIAGAQKIGFRDPDLPQRGTNRRPGTLAHADGRLLLRLDETNFNAGIAARRIARRQHSGGNPAGGTPADNQNFHGNAAVAPEMSWFLRAISAGICESDAI